jgi:hypothetical protein
MTLNTLHCLQQHHYQLLTLLKMLQLHKGSVDPPHTKSIPCQYKFPAQGKGDVHIWIALLSLGDGAFSLSCSSASALHDILCQLSAVIHYKSSVTIETRKTYKSWSTHVDCPILCLEGFQTCPGFIPVQIIQRYWSHYFGLSVSRSDSINDCSPM